MKYLKPFLFLSLLISACGPVATPLPPAETQVVPLVEITQPPVESALTAEPGKIHPSYLPLATRPNIPPQTIEGVTAVIDWAYADESRISMHYTISGLDWPDGTHFDGTLVRISSDDAANIGYGGGGWSNESVENGVTSGSVDQYFMDGDLDAGIHPNISLSVDIPVDGTNAMIFPTPNPDGTQEAPVTMALSVIGTFHFEFTLPVYKGLKFEDLDQTVTANNVSMTLKTLVVNPSHVEALICFQMPSALDWQLTASKVELGGVEYPYSNGGLIHGGSGKDFTLNDAERCASIGFDAIYDESVSSVTLTIPKLVSSIPDVITKDRVEMANQRLADKGIAFDYESGDHGSNIVVLKRPDGATDMDIYPLIWDALADQYEGPWVFTVDLRQ